MSSFPEMLAPLRRRLILRKMIVAALIGIGVGSFFQLSFSIYAIFAHTPNSFSFAWILLVASLGLIVAWQTRPSLFQTALRLDDANNTADLFSSAIQIAQAPPPAMAGLRDRDFALALNTLAAQTLRKIKPEPFVLLKRLAPPVILLLTLSLALSLWPISPKSPSSIASGAPTHSSEKTNPSPTLFHPDKNPIMPDPTSESPGNSLFAPQPQAGRGYSGANPTDPRQVASGAIQPQNSNMDNSTGFPSVGKSSPVPSWQGVPRSSNGQFNQNQTIPANYNDVLNRYFSRSGL